MGIPHCSPAKTAEGMPTKPAHLLYLNPAPAGGGGGGSDCTASCCLATQLYFTAAGSCSTLHETKGAVDSTGSQDPSRLIQPQPLWWQCPPFCLVFLLIQAA